MDDSSSIGLVATPKNLLGLAAIFLLAAAIFGALNNSKTKALRVSVAEAEAAQKASEVRRAAMERQIQARGAVTPGSGNSKLTEIEAKAAKAEADLQQAQQEKAELATKLQENQTAMAALQQQLETGTAKPPDISATPSVANPGELQVQLDAARGQLESAEREKSLLTDKLRGIQERSDKLQEEVKRSRAGSARLGLRGTVLAVNQAYNFVVLNLGGRQGVEANSEMLVVRDGTPIGRIRISSVEPATAIGDIITSSLPRGVQVQPGDIVIYAGSNS